MFCKKSITTSLALLPPYYSFLEELTPRLYNNIENSIKSTTMAIVMINIGEVGRLRLLPNTVVAIIPGINPNTPPNRYDQ
jgi:hypothetical protein